MTVDLSGLSVPAIVRHVDTNAAYIALDAEVDAAEGDGIMARWKFGRKVLDERLANGGNQLPPGRIDEICAAVSKSQAEVSNRAQFAAEYDTVEKVSRALETFKSWDRICKYLGTRAVNASTENEWYTPARYIESARAVLGRIDLDPASSKAANEVIAATEFYTADDDGLSQPWRGHVWLNPPYGDLPGPFIARLVEAHASGDVPAAIALVNAHCTDTAWFEPLWDHTLCFTDHRIDFEAANRKKTSTSTHGSVFAYLGPDPLRFLAEFERYGAVVRQWSA